MDPKFALPTRKWLSNKALNDLYAEHRKRIQSVLDSDLPKVKTITITVDGWTSRSKDHFYSLTLQYLKDCWMLIRYTLECSYFPGEQGSDNIHDKVAEMAMSWGIDIEDNSRDIYIVTDNHVPICAALRESNAEHLRCAIHTLQLGIEDSFKECEGAVDDLLATCRSIVGHYNHSTKSNERLHVTQERLGVPEHDLVQCVDTRWNSTYLMLQRLLEQKEALCVDLPKIRIARRTVEISSEDWLKISDLVTILQPAYEATLELSQGVVPTYSMVLPAVNSIMTGLVSTSGSSFTRNFKRVLARNVKARFSRVENDTNYALATLVDPRFKNLLLSESQNRSAKAALHQKVSAMIRRELMTGNEEENPPETPETPAEKTPLLWQTLNQKSQATQLGTSSELTPVDAGKKEVSEL